MSNTFHPFSVEPASNGFIIKVGCKLLVYQRTQLVQLLMDIEAYIKDPAGTEKRLAKKWGWLPTQPIDPVGAQSEASPVPKMPSRA